MALRAFIRSDYERLINWIDSDELNYQWGGPTFDFPLNAYQISQHCAQPDVWPFMFSVSGESVGYAELFKTSEYHFRICRVFIAKPFRGQGIANQMLCQLIQLATSEYRADALSLAVFEHNTAAIRCYESLGFVVTSRESGMRSFSGESWVLLRMEKSLLSSD